MRTLKPILFITIIFFYSCKKELKNEIVYPFYRYNILKANHLKGCPKEIVPYYQLNAKHHLSSSEIKEQVNNVVKIKHINEEGYITFNFVVNCFGQLGEFVIFELDLDYKQKEFDDYLINDLKSFVEKFDKFKKIEGKNYYYYLTFKILNGEVDQVLP